MAELDPAGLIELCEEKVRQGEPSISVAVGQGRDVVFAKAFGHADLIRRKQATPDTPYLLASVTKPITATAVCVLAEDGRLDLDDPVERHAGDIRLPRRPGGPSGAPTVRQVLQHIGGLGAYYDFFYADSAAGDPPPRPPFGQMLTRYGTLFREPGATYEYSNLGYGLLDAVIGSVTGEDPAEFVRDRVFRPIDAHSGWIGATYEGGCEPAARCTADVGRAYPDYDTTHRGASLAWLSAPDLARFGLSHAGGRTVLGNALLSAARAPGPEVGGDNDGSSYGLGWGVRESAGHTVLSHSGAMGGVATNLTVVPERGISVAVLINRTDGNATVREIRDHVLAALVAGYQAPTIPVPIEAVGPPVTPGIWRGSIASHEGDIPLAVRVHEDGAVLAEVAGGSTVTVSVVPRSVGDAFGVTLDLQAQLPTADARANSPAVRLGLDESGGRLRGAARAIKLDEDATWVGNCRSHWCELVLS